MNKEGRKILREWAVELGKDSEELASPYVGPGQFPKRVRVLCDALIELLDELEALHEARHTCARFRVESFSHKTMKCVDCGREVERP